MTVWQNKKKLTEDDPELLKRILEIKTQYPQWGNRSVWEHLHYMEGIAVDKRCVLHLMRKHNLLVHLSRKL